MPFGDELRGGSRSGAPSRRRTAAPCAGCRRSRARRAGRGWRCRRRGSPPCSASSAARRWCRGRRKTRCRPSRRREDSEELCSRLRASIPRVRHSRFLHGRTPSPSTELRAQFGDIDIYLFDQLLRGRFDARPPRPRRRLRRRTQPAVFSRARLRGLRDRRGSRRRSARRASWPRALAPTLPPDNIRQGALHALPWPDGRMDAVICSAVLHFARDRTHFERMLDEMWRVLAPGGLFFARLASSIGIEPLVTRHDRPRPPPRRLRSLRRRRALLLDADARPAARTLLDPIKTTNVQNQRCMTTWVIEEVAESRRWSACAFADASRAAT